SPLAFGDVFVNNCSIQTLTVSNVGGTDLSVSSAALSGSGDFSILSGGAPFTVTGGGTHDIEILFTPTTEGLAEATLTIASDDPDESSVEVAITGNGSTEAVIVFDDMEHGDPGGNGWFAFGGSVGGGGIDPNFVDIPPVAGGSASLQTGWGSGGNPGIFGGFGRTSPTNIDGTTYFNFWILPDAGQEYVITIQLQDDDNGDDVIPFPPTSDDDEFQYDLKVGGADAEVIPNGEWQLVSIPLEDFYDDNSFLPGGNGVFDPSPVACGGNGQLIAVVFGIESISGADATFRTDYWSFSNGPLGAEIAAMPSPLDFGDVVAGSCAVDTVKITNPGFADLEVSAVMLGGTDAAAFSILSGGDPFMISPGETQDIAILFSPAAEQSYSAYLSLTSNDTADSPLLVDLIGTGVEPGIIVFDDMEHGNPTPGNNGWFQFPGDPSTGGGYGPITDDLPPTLGGTTAVVTGWGGANPGIYGGFGRNFPLDISQSTHFNFWINPLDPANPNNTDQEFILQIQLQEDDNGDGMITADQDDEYQYNLKVGGADGEVIAGGGWQFVSIPLSEFFYDNSFLFGGNQVFDPEKTVCGGNGELIAIAITVQGIAPGQAANFRMDYLAFSTGPLSPEIVAMPNPVDFGEVTETSCAQQVLTITNGGVVPLEIEAMNLMGVQPTPFSILEGDAPVTILPEETHEVILSFKPEDREAYEEILQIISNDTSDSPLEILLMGEGTKPGVVVFDDMEHGNPGGNGWFSFGGPVGGGGIDPNFADLPSVNGGSASLQTGWGSGGNPGVLGGFGRTSPTDIGPATHFNFWINPDAGQEYIISVQLQDDDNGDNAIPFPPTGDDDEFQYDLKVGGADAEVIPGGGWQFVSIPLADFYDDNSFLFGGNGVFDPEPVSCGGNGQLIAVIFGIETITGADATFRTDYWSFSNGPVITSFILVDADSNTDVTPIEDGDLLLLQDLPENFNIVAVVEGAEEINRVVLDLNGPVENERTERKAPYAVFGDRNGNFTGRPTEAGMYDITATPYYMDGGLVEGTCLTIGFEIGDCDIIGDIANAGPNQELDCVSGEATLQGSVTQGPDTAPFMVEWTGPNGYTSSMLMPTVTEAGVYTLTITGGVTGCVSTDEVVVEPCQVDCEPETSRFVLVNSDTNEDIMVLEDEAEIDLTIVGRALNIRAEVLCGDKTESMRLVLTGAQSRTRTENKAPYALAGDSNGNYSNQNFVPGDYMLRATPYTEKNAQGDAGTQLSITFTVQNGGRATQTGFEDPSLDPQSELSVFPVPPNKEFFIDMKFFEEGVYDAAIFDVAGRVVMSQKLVYDAAAEKRFTIKSDQLSVGVYMVRVSGQNYQTWRKITIRR
ncbi:MAG: choice-of-anchor D domain-containing protein, partial [Bacteroidota bacterium]